MSKLVKTVRQEEQIDKKLIFLILYNRLVRSDE